MPLDLTGLTRRPDPVDAHPLKVTIFGVTRDGHVYRTGFWTTLFSLSEPPPLTFFNDFGTALRQSMSTEMTVVGGGYKLKAAPAYTDMNLISVLNGLVVLAGGVHASNAAALGYGGKTVDATGLTRNIRTISHTPCGYITTAELGKEHRTTDDTPVFNFLNWFVNQAPCDSFGRPLEVYQYFDLQVNAFYQKGRGQ